MEEPRERSRSLRRSQSSLSWAFGRSKSSRLLQESLSSAAAAPLPSYERLSRSVRLREETRSPTTQRNWLRRVMGVVFFRRDGERGMDEATASGGVNDAFSMAEGKGTERRKRSPWLPDPDRRWPVQGW